MREIEVYAKADEMNNNNYAPSILGIYKDNAKDHEASLRKYSYSQAEFNDHPFDLVARKRDSWSLNETIQKLYDLDSNITRKMFLDEYFNFMKKRGAVVTKIPVVAKLPLDLYRLYNAVQSFGGYAQVVKKRKWSRVVRDLGLPPSITSAAYTLRTQYLRLLYHFECEKNGVAANNLFFYEEQESIKQWSPGPMQHYESSPPSPKRHKSDDFENDKLDRNMNDLKADDEKEDGDSQVTFVELSRDKREKSYEKHYNDDIDEDVTQTLTFMKRSKSEEIFRHHSLGDDEIINVRPSSYDSVMNKRSKDNEDEEISRKRKHEDEDTEDLNERRHSENQEERVTINENGLRHTEDNISVKSISPKPINSEISPRLKRNFDSHHMERYRTVSRDKDTVKNRTVGDYINRENHRRYLCSDLPPNHRQISRYDSDHHSNGNGSYPLPPISELSSPSKLSCQCNDCHQSKQQQRSQMNDGDGNHLPGSGYHHHSPPYNLHSPPSQIVPKNCLSPHYPINGYERHSLKKQYEIEDQRLKRYNVYRGPNRNEKLTTNPSEMTLKIKERTENAVVLSIVVDGIYYSGTLLTSLKR